MKLRVTVALFLFAALAAAQTRDTAAVFGAVTDAQSAAIPGAQVAIVSTATGQVTKTTTNESGEYIFNLLPVGSYTLSVEHSAFRRYQRTGLLLQANENVKVDVALEIGDMKTVVSVDAAGSQIEARASTIKETVDRARVVELPLNGRNAADLALLVPGVSPASGNTGDVSGNTQPRGMKSLSVNGSRNNNVRFTLDGGENMDNHHNLNLPFPFPDALQEFSVETSNMSVHHGSSSAAAVNVVTKSGTNEIHGDVFWFVRNTELNATNFFSRQQDKLKRNQGGFTLGGPLRKNKLFAFGGFQQLWIRSASGDSRNQTLTAAERAGDFSNNKITIYDPLNGQPFTNNTIPKSRLSPAALKVLAVSPLPDADGYTRYVISSPENGQQYIGRMDYIHSARHNFMFRAFENDQSNPFHSLPDNIHASRVAIEQNSINASVAHNFIVSANMIAHTQLTGMHIKSRSQSDFPKSFRDFGVNVYAPSNDIHTVMTNSGASMDAPERTAFNRASEEFIHDWVWNKGAHTFVWGTQFAWKQYNEDTVWRSSGYFQFDGSATGSGNLVGFDRADFMLGSFSFFTQNNGELENRRQPTKGFYFGDTWRITRRLTLNLGLRYEPYSFFWDTHDRNQTFDAANYQNGVKSKIFLNAPAGLLYRGDARPGGGTYGRSVAEPDNNNLAPRVGFAWDPFGDGKTSIRSGFGIFYDAPSLRQQNNANNVSPFSYSTMFNEGLLDDPYRGREKSNRFPVTTFGPDSPFDSPLETIVLDSKYITTYTQNWNFTVEREVVKDTRLRIAYVGAMARHLKGEWDQNAPIYNPNLTLAQNRATIDARRPRKEFQRILRFYHGQGSSYNALQLSVDKRYSRRFTVLGSYTWSKSLDYMSTNQAAQDSASSYPFNFGAGRGPSNFNRPQRLTGSFVWDLPGVKHRAVNAILGDWKMSGILTLQSGGPFTVAATGDPMAGIAGARSNLIGAGNPVLDAGRPKGERIAAYFDKSRFTNALPNTLGTLGRNILEGPGFSNFDISMVKLWKMPFLRENGRGQFRFEAFNLFNRTNFNNPNTGLTNSNFGRLTGSGSPRIVQLALKLSF